MVDYPFEDRRKEGLVPTVTATRGVSMPQAYEPTQIERVFDPKQYLSEMQGAVAGRNSDIGMLQKLGVALQLQNPQFNASAFINNYKNNELAQAKAKWDLLSSADQASVDRQISDQMMQWSNQNPDATDADFRKWWGSLGFPNMSAMKNTYEAWRTVSPKLKPENTLLTSNVYTPESRKKYGRSGKIEDLILVDTRGYKDVGELRTVEGNFRKEYIKEAKDFSRVTDAYGRILAATDLKTGAGDIAIVFNYMKMLDPNSVVRESEYATAENAGGVMKKIRNMWNRLVDGDRLDVTVRQELLDATAKLFKEKDGVQQRLIKQYSGLADRANVDPRNVILRYAPRVMEGGKEFILVGTHKIPVEVVDDEQLNNSNVLDM